MALRAAMLKGAGEKVGYAFGPGRRWAHAVALPPPLDSVINAPTISPSLVLPEIDRDAVNGNGGIGFDFPNFSFSGGSMELMAVPKTKISRHKKGIRNGPKALKPIPVIIRCKSCGRVKLPHFFCCSGERGNNGERDGASN
ncbi:50S ribosomal protein [Actinidia chinensis var. chinensis]|uniref:Large ribosomal subunit protein bL32m n=1 Tax=Actinidia chinensis var. chinensis TaxID=1590841 RepID=A0A2R6QQS1_ACTCC|nr:50S ribosomal protein [Actinidia chinensis var. chinensis]